MDNYANKVNACDKGEANSEKTVETKAVDDYNQQIPFAIFDINLTLNSIKPTTAKLEIKYH